ncbi:hypothetical protein AB0C15_26370 [Micromonospora sp. NPDC048835]|uniref:hypothetical protein n=1 Tax=Micromonospora sp. NPDC048835 TaxID=3155147 RepID=UPI0033EBD78B
MTPEQRHESFAPGAASLVDELAKAWRAELVAQSYREVAGRSSEKADVEVTVAEVQAAFDKLYSPPTVFGRKARSFTAMVFGFVILIALGYLYSLNTVNMLDQIASVAGVVVGVLGLAFAALAQATRIRSHHLGRIARAATADRALATVRFMQGYADLEEKIRRQVSAADPDMPENAPLGALLRKYVETADLSGSDHYELRQLVQLRNEIVHHTLTEQDAARVGTAIPVLEKQLDRFAHS